MNVLVGQLGDDFSHFGGRVWRLRLENLLARLAIEGCLVIHDKSLLLLFVKDVLESETAGLAFAFSDDALILIFSRISFYRL